MKHNMQNKYLATGLEDAISQLENKQSEEVKLIKEHFNLAYESIKPVNIIKNTFKDIAASQDIKENIVNVSVAILSGYLSKTLFESTSRSPFKKLVGTALMFGITTVVEKNPETVKLVGIKIWDAITNKSHKSFQEAHN